MSEFSKSFSHPARILVIRSLLRHGPQTVEQLLKQHPISKPSLSQHLAILRNARLLEWKEKFPYTIYSIKKEALAGVKKEMKAFFQSL